jgi:hypothetical protein
MSHNRSKGVLDVKLITALVMTAVLVLGAVSMATASPGPVGAAAGFEDDDGDMTPQAVFDWNSFAPVTWVGTAPYRTSTHADNGWTFLGIEDAVVTNQDSAFAGGTKQDDACPTVNTGKAPNKDDLQRVYLATKVADVDPGPGVEYHTFLMLAWHRIPQNTTSPSAHIGFEFNQGTDGPCGGSSDGLLKRVAGDFLVVYDFEGGSTTAPVITLREWTTNPADSCEVSSDSPPCWGTAHNLTALGYAEAKVNTFGSIDDLLSPGATAQNPDVTGTNEFGEAGIDLTAADVFAPGTCESFGSVFAVSRSSGNSGTAQMKDIDGPADFTISNCGTVTIRKVTDPSGDTNTNFTFSTSVETDDNQAVSDFNLMDGQHKDITNVDIGTGLNVTESDPSPNYKLTSIDCSASSTTNYSTDKTTRAVTFDIAAGDSLDCTFTNTLQRGAIKISKTSTKGGGGLDGATFSIVKGTPIPGSPFTTANGGTICVDNLLFGTYSVQETAAPTGYKIDDGTAQNVSVNANSTCGDGNEATFSATDTPLTDLLVKATGEASPAGTTKTTITCVDSNNAGIGNSPQGPADPAQVTANGLMPGTYTCTVVVDP